ncbi:MULTISPECIES: SDR family oxidoreductase [unclassified Undibacterium]|uniref:SDR family oxidoreductase n=1 Tax=unclassified Undibacterium TaxID=2630295 RepID=UPI001331D074|nr:SDR family oxidoreductase [Undibacterium sp. KW1]BBB58451.1 short chain dehydrogenase [Undibacterium sp. KW1]
MKAKHKVVVITGSSDGIGAEIARQLAKKYGPSLALVLAARNEEALKKVAAECKAFGAVSHVVKTDVGMEANCRHLIEAAVEQFGSIDVLINNAGKSAQALLEEVDNLGWYQELMRINFWGSVWCTHAALPHLKKSRGTIVAVSSLAGLIGVPGRTAYSASKFAMGGFFESLRSELKEAGVRVTVAYPGVVATQIRYHGYNAAGEAAGKSGLKEDDAMSIEECASLIIRGYERGDRDVVMSFKGKLGRWLKLIAPGLVEKMAMAALKKEVRPH